MSKADRSVAPSMNWLVEGTEDHFKDYTTRPRAELPCATLSDDVLANYAFMNYDRDKDTELEVMLGRKPGEFPKIAFMTAVKERIRWLARQLAIYQGVYPGIPSPMAITPPLPPTLAMLGDNGGVVTVNPDWCDWYEQVFNVPAGQGYIAGREIMQQIDAVQAEHFDQTRSIMSSAIHAMMKHDPNTTGSRFSTVAEAKASIDHGPNREVGFKHSTGTDWENGDLVLTGHFSVKDLEAILFIRRAEKLIELAKEKFGAFIETAAANGGLENVDVNQLMQVLRPGQEVTDMDSTIFAAPVAEPYRPSPMAETFNSVVDAKATLERSGILRQNFTRSPGSNTFAMEGYFQPQDLEALLYLYRNNDPMVFPEKDADGLPKDKPRSIWNSLSGKPVPEGYDVTPPEMQEGDVLHRTHITSDSHVLHIAYDGNGDQAFYLCTKLGNLLKVDREPEGARGKVPSSEQAVLPTGNDTLNRLITEGGGLRRGEFHAISAATPAEKSLVKPDDSPERLDVTGRPLPKFIITDLPGGNAVEKDLTVLREMDPNDLSESLDWIIKGYPLSDRDDQRFIGFTLNDFAKVAAERIKQLQSDNYSLQSEVSGLQHQIDN